MTTPIMLKALAGETVSRRPLWIMRQAGRYLPEYRAMRKEYSFLELMGEPSLATEVTLLPFQHFAFDAAIVFADIMSPLHALGLEVTFEPGPVLRKPLRTAADIDRLPEVDPETVAPEVMETLTRVRRALPEETALLGFAGEPLTLAAYLVQGRGSRNFPWLRALAVSDPKAFGRLQARLSRLVAGYLRRQIEAGAQAVQIFGSWAGVLSPSLWKRLVYPHLRELLEEVGRSGAPRILFLNDATHIVGEALSLPYEALAVDWQQDLEGLRQRLGPDRALQGNLDPAVLLSGPKQTAQATRELLQRMPRQGHIVNLGHGILPETPLDSVRAMLETVHQEAA